MQNMTKTTGKTTLTFDQRTYSNLLSLYQPKIIKTEEENEIFLKVVEELISRKELTPEENALLELLVKLIEDFEDKHYQINTSTPQSRFLHLMEARGLKQADLSAILGSSEVTDGILNKQLEISQEKAEALGEFFHVDPSLFLLD